MQELKKNKVFLSGFKLSFFSSYSSLMGIIAPSAKTGIKHYAGSKKVLNDAMSYAANQYIESPLDGTQKTQWQAVVDRLYKTAIYAESDKDATSAAKVIAERLFGRAPVQKQENKHEIPAIIFADRDDALEQIAEKASRAEPDNDDAEVPFGVTFEDGTEVLI
jgi:hypothetical protein